MTAVILAAGRSMRFRGNKITEPLTEYGETLLDVTLYDLIRLGFDDFIFILHPETEPVFRHTIVARLPHSVTYRVLLQTNEASIPNGCLSPIGRRTPLGTGHALLIAEAAIAKKGCNDFLVLGASHYYGYRIVYDLLYGMDTCYQREGQAHFALPAFHLGNCLSSKGPISTAVAEYDTEGYAVSLREYDRISVSSDYRFGEYEKKGSCEPISFDAAACMGLYFLTPAVFPYLRRGFARFLTDPDTDLFHDEYPLSSAIHDMILSKAARAKLFFAMRAPLALHTESEVPYMRERLYKLLSEENDPNGLWTNRK